MVQLQHHLIGNTVQKEGLIVQDAMYTLNQRIPQGTVSLAGRLVGYRNQGREVELVPLITPSDPQRKFLSHNLGPYRVRSPGPQRGSSSPRHIPMVPLNYKL